MTKDIIKEEKKRIAGMLAEYNRNVSSITEEMAGIDAKYKALAKKEKEALSASLSVYKDLIKGASKLYASLGENEEPIIPDENKQVVDTLFPENNKEEDIPEVKETIDKPSDEPDAEEGDIETEEDTEEIPDEEIVEEGEEVDEEDEWSDKVEEW